MVEVKYKGPGPRRNASTTACAIAAKGWQSWPHGRQARRGPTAQSRTFTTTQATRHRPAGGNVKLQNQGDKR